MAHSTRRTVRAGLALLLIVSFASFSQHRPAFAADWAKGDVIVAISGGAYKVFDNTGVFKETISDSLSGFTTGCAFDSHSDLYTTNFSATRVTKFDGDHPHSILQTINTGAASPAGNSESIVFAGNGDFYVGHAGGNADIHRYDAAGVLQQTYNVITERRGSDWMDLAADQQTMFYTSEGGRIMRYNVSGTGAQLPDFANIGGLSFALRLLPPGDGTGGLLVAHTSNVKRLNGSGTVVQTYDAPGEDSWFSLNLDPNGTSFWAGNYNSSRFYRFNIATGAIEVGPISSGTGPSTVFGICVKGEITVAQEICGDGIDNDGDGLIDEGCNQPPTTDAGGPYSGSEGAAISLDGTVSDPDAGDTAMASWSYTPGAGVDAGATCSFADASAVDTTITCTDDGEYMVTLTADDGEADPVTSSATLTVNNVAPTVDITAPTDGALYALGAAVNLLASFTDPGNNDSHTCAITWDDQSATLGVVAPGACTDSHTFAAAGVYTIQATVTDDDGASSSDTVMVVVYDPSGGFVTGGGWIDSPAGAYAADPSMTGRANFGFVSKYQPGATTPTGETEFQFKAGNLNFHCSSYDWLVIAGSKAQYKGTGTINGTGDYGFLLTAIDGATDKFRIKIWDKATNSVVYDNQMGDTDNADPSTVLGGGAIVIHK